jgi:hypothetical protein
MSTIYFRLIGRVALDKMEGSVKGRKSEAPAGGTMIRERALQGVLVAVGLIFTATIYPLTMFFRAEAALAMMMSLYVTLGIFLLMAARNPAAHRSLIAFTAWSSLVHAGVMGMQAYANIVKHVELVGVAALVLIGFVLIVLAPAKAGGQG